jgi:hypothetical protein
MFERVKGSMWNEDAEYFAYKVIKVPTVKFLKMQSNISRVKKKDISAVPYP